MADNPDHRRAKLVRLTPRGRRAFDDMAARQAAWANMLGERFDVAEIARTTELVSSLGRAMLADAAD